jgi:probable F420-dependent oxidoreductase
MKIGVTIPNSWGVEDVSEVIRLGVLAEELGYASVWTMDHLFNIGFVRTRLDDRPYYHPLAILTFLAGATSRIALGTSVLVLPYHNPVELAKYAATLDQLSKGRLILGVGAGAMLEEFEALGVSLHERASLTNESIRVMKELWTKHEPEYHSQRWSFGDLRFAPKPYQQPHMPLWVGGASPGARRRAGLLGTGWHPNGVPAEEYLTQAEEVRQIAASAGRDPDAIEMSLRMNVTGELDTGRLTASLQAYEDVGVRHVCLALESGDVPKLEDTMRRIAAEVMPALA